jgi:hypothetical protein
MKKVGDEYRHTAMETWYLIKGIERETFLSN